VTHTLHVVVVVIACVVQQAHHAFSSFDHHVCMLVRVTKPANYPEIFLWILSSVTLLASKISTTLQLIVHRPRHATVAALLDFCHHGNAMAT
jgi:hypothetical protein